MSKAPTDLLPTNKEIHLNTPTSPSIDTASFSYLDAIAITSRTISAHRSTSNHISQPSKQPLREHFAALFSQNKLPMKFSYKLNTTATTPKLLSKKMNSSDQAIAATLLPVTPSVMKTKPTINPLNQLLNQSTTNISYSNKQKVIFQGPQQTLLRSNSNINNQISNNYQVKQLQTSSFQNNQSLSQHECQQLSRQQFSDVCPITRNNYQLDSNTFYQSSNNHQSLSTLKISKQQPFSAVTLSKNTSQAQVNPNFNQNIATTRHNQLIQMVNQRSAKQVSSKETSQPLSNSRVEQIVNTSGLSKPLFEIPLMNAENYGEQKSRMNASATSVQTMLIEKTFLHENELSRIVKQEIPIKFTELTNFLEKQSIDSSKSVKMCLVDKHCLESNKLQGIIQSTLDSLFRKERDIIRFLQTQKVQMEELLNKSIQTLVLKKKETSELFDGLQSRTFAEYKQIRDRCLASSIQLQISQKKIIDCERIIQNELTQKKVSDQLEFEKERIVDISAYITSIQTKEVTDLYRFKATQSYHVNLSFSNLGNTISNLIGNSLQKLRTSFLKTNQPFTATTSANQTMISSSKKKRHHSSMLSKSTAVSMSTSSQIPPTSNRKRIAKSTISHRSPNHCKSPTILDYRQRIETPSIRAESSENKYNDISFLSILEDSFSLENLFSKESSAVSQNTLINSYKKKSLQAEKSSPFDPIVLSKRFTTNNKLSLTNSMDEDIVSQHDQKQIIVAPLKSVYVSFDNQNSFKSFEQFYGKGSILSMQQYNNEDKQAIMKENTPQNEIFYSKDKIRDFNYEQSMDKLEQKKLFYELKLYKGMTRSSHDEQDDCIYQSAKKNRRDLFEQEESTRKTKENTPNFSNKKIESQFQIDSDKYSFHQNVIKKEKQDSSLNTLQEFSVHEQAGIESFMKQKSQMKVSHYRSDSCGKLEQYNLMMKKVKNNQEQSFQNCESIHNTVRTTNSQTIQQEDYFDSSTTSSMATAGTNHHLSTGSCSNQPNIPILSFGSQPFPFSSIVHHDSALEIQNQAIQKLSNNSSIGRYNERMSFESDLVELGQFRNQ